MSEHIASLLRSRPALLLFFVLLLSSFTALHAADSFDIRNFTTIDGNGAHVIHVPEGVHRISGPILLSSNTILEGDGPGTIIEPAADFLGERFITNADFTAGNENITVRSLKVRFKIRALSGSAPGVLRFENMKNLSIADVSMELETAFYGIDLSANVRDAAVERCSINNQGGGGAIQVRNRDPHPAHASANIIISGNDISSAGDEPLAVFGWLGNLSGISVTDNIVSAPKASFGITTYGIDTPGHTGSLGNVRIIGNAVCGGKNGAIGVKGGASDILLDGNTVSNTVNDGIFLDAGGNGLPHIHNIRVLRNRLTDAGRHGIYAAGADIEIMGNSVNGCKGAGIYICEFPGSRIDVENNLIEKTTRGIIVDGRMHGTISGNSIKRSGSILYLKR